MSLPYTPERLRLLISAAGGPSKVALMAIRHGIKICDGYIRHLQLHGLANNPYEGTVKLVELLEAQYGEAIKNPPTHAELAMLIKHFGGPARTTAHLEQHHPHITARLTRVRALAHHGGADLKGWPMTPLGVMVCLALREDAPKFVPFHGHYKGNRFNASLRGKFPSLE